MIDTTLRRLPRGSLFFACNAIAALFVAIFILTPIVSHFSSRSEEIAEKVSLVSRFQNVQTDAKALIARLLPSTEPFLNATEDRLASADLQASLKVIGEGAGIRFVAIRGVQGDVIPPLKFVAVNVELEAAPSAVRDFITTIEKQSPMLFVTTASLRSLTDGDDAIIHADLKIQGAMRHREPRTDGFEAHFQ